MSHEPNDGGPWRVFVTTPGFEAAAISEWSALLPQAARGDAAAVVSHQRGSGLVVVRDLDVADPAAVGAGAAIDLIFARQQLPAAREVRGGSVAALAEAAYQLVQAAVDASAGPFSIHAFAPTGAETSLASRAGFVARDLLGRLGQRRRRAARNHLSPEAAAPAFAQVQLLIQILLVDRDRAWVSAARPRPLPHGGWDLSPWVAGVAPIVDDRAPPSRAYRKLEEAFAWMDDQPAATDLCVDLGGSPGGWTYTALKRGASVIAVDRAPLEPPVRGHPRLTMLEGNAFTYEPPADRLPVDWLLSDVICEPARALAQLQRWVIHHWTRRLIMTIKFKGDTGYGMLASVRAVLHEVGCPRLRIKHLHHNKNEVTVMACLPVGASQPAGSPPPSAGAPRARPLGPVPPSPLRRGSPPAPPRRPVRHPPPAPPARSRRPR